MREEVRVREAVAVEQCAQGDRAIAVEGLANIRDLGGLRTVDGRRVRRRRVVRSDNLCGLTDSGVSTMLGGAGLGMILDLRTEEEVAREGRGPLADAAVRYVNIPLQSQAALNMEEATAGRATTLLDDYLAHLEASGPKLVAGLSLLADEGNLPAVVHCTAGKDRTGVVTALLLDLLGVEREAIVADYAETAPAMESVLEQIRASSFFQSKGLADAPTWIFEAKPETMRAFLETLHTRHGGAAAWVQQQGMPAGTVERIRTNVLD